MISGGTALLCRCEDFTSIINFNFSWDIIIPLVYTLYWYSAKRKVFYYCTDGASLNYFFVHFQCQSTLTGERDISIEISIVSSSAEILVEYFAVSGSINTTTPHITVEAQYVGISTLPIERVTNYIFTNITDATNSR